MFRRIAVVTVLAVLGLVLVALAFIPPHATAQMDSTSGFVVDQTYDAVWGNVSPRATVTVARGAAYGHAQANGVGFFWTPLWQSNGEPADITGTDTLAVYVNGNLVQRELAVFAPSGPTCTSKSGARARPGRARRIGRVRASSTATMAMVQPQRSSPIRCRSAPLTSPTAAAFRPLSADAPSPGTWALWEQTHQTISSIWC